MKFENLEFSEPFKAHKLIGLTILVCLIYSVFLNTFNAEYVEFGQTLAGLIPINTNNEFYFLRQADSSLQIVLPAILLKVGLAPVVVGVTMSFLSQLVAFLAVVLIVFYFTQSSLVSFFCIFTFFKAFPNDHYYPFIFPTAFAAFGAVGMWTSLICIFLFLNDFKKGAFLLLGLLISIHLVWFVPAFIFMAYFMLKYRPQKAHIIFLVFGLLLSASSFATFRYFKSHYFEKSFYTTQYDTHPIDQFQWTKLSEDNKTLRSIFQLHNPKLVYPEFSKTISSIWKLSVSSFTLFLLIFLILKCKLIQSAKVKNILVPYFLVFLMSWGMLAFIEISDMLKWQNSLVSLVLRVIPNRFFNFSYAFTVIFAVAALFSVFMHSRYRWLRVVAAILLFYVLKDPYNELPKVFFILVCLAFLYYRKPHPIETPL